MPNRGADLFVDFTSLFFRGELDGVSYVHNGESEYEGAAEDLMRVHRVAVAIAASTDANNDDLAHGGARTFAIQIDRQMFSGVIFECQITPRGTLIFPA